jgi:predicted nucleotidyltransferase
MSAKIRIPVPHEAVAEFCRRHGIRRLAFFGSVTRDDFTPESDVDVLVEYEPDRVPGLITMAGQEIQLSELLGRKVDLRTPGDLSRHFRDEVLAEAKTEYDASR